MLSLYSLLLENTIGIIHVCPQNKKLRIAVIDFMGRQILIDATVDELLKAPKSEPKFGLYRTITLDVDNEKLQLKMPIDRGDINDVRLYRKLFVEINKQKK